MKEVKSWAQIQGLLTPKGHKSILEAYYPLALFGHFLGFFPVQKILLGFRGVRNFEFRWRSLAVLYTVLLNIVLYIFSSEATFKYWQNGRQYFKFGTDAFAIQFFLAIFILSRSTFHWLTIFRTKNIYNCLVSLEKYDEDFKFDNRTTLVNRYVLIYLVGTVLNSIGNVSASFSEVFGNLQTNLERDEERKFLIGYIIPNVHIAIVLIYSVHFIAECALFLFHCSISFVVNGICDRVTGIIAEIREISDLLDGCYTISEQEFSQTCELKTAETVSIWMDQLESSVLNPKTSTPSNKNNKILPNNPKIFITTDLDLKRDTYLSDYQSPSGMAYRIRTISKKVSALLDILDKLNGMGKETMLVFTAASTIILISLCYLITILLTQYVPASSDRIYQFSEIIPIIFIATLTFLRLLNFVNTGEKLERNGHKLRMWINRIFARDTEVLKELYYLKGLCSTTDFQLSAGGFFFVRRMLLTAILGPFITFIVILAQFRATDMQVFGNHNFTYYNFESGESSWEMSLSKSQSGIS